MKKTLSLFCRRYRHYFQNVLQLLFPLLSFNLHVPRFFSPFTIYYLLFTIYCFLLAQPAFCFLDMPQQDRFGIQAELRPPDGEFGKPKDMVSIVPNRPVAARDKYGNRMYFSPSGKLMAKISVDGSVELSLSVKSKELDANGNLVKTTERMKGTNLSVIKDDKDRVIGYQQLGFGGKVIKEFDKDMNEVKSYQYNKYGKNTEWVLDELTQTKTIYNDRGNAIADVNFENKEVAWYTYDKDNKMALKTDIYDNKTSFNKFGQMEQTVDKWGKIVSKYNYITDENGNQILDTSEDLYGNITQHKNGRPQTTKTKDGIVEREWSYDGQTLTFTFDHNTNEIMWYDIDGKPMYSTNNENISKEWIYSKGHLLGLWDEQDDSLTAYVYSQEVSKLWLNEKPTAEKLQLWLDEGFVKKTYTE